MRSGVRKALKEKPLAVQQQPVHIKQHALYGFGHGGILTVGDNEKRALR
jgi:hypothetical protein|tara:strand:+ start:353 stop:499 length:147 start_codon:yes stop_codon:yes gene_type:complete